MSVCMSIRTSAHVSAHVYANVYTGLINLDEFIEFTTTIADGVQPDRVDRQIAAMTSACPGPTLT